MDNTRLLVATLLSAIVLVLWGVYFQPQPPVEPPPAESGETPAGAEEGAAAGDGTAPATDRSGDGTQADAAGTDAEDVLQPAETVSSLDFGAERVVGERQQIVRVDTPRSYVEFDTRGAVLRTYLLKTQVDAQGDPLDMVRPRGDDLYPFAILGEQDGSRLNTALWEVEESRDEAGLPQVRFRHLSEAGAAEKIFRWDEAGFMRVEIRVDRMREWGVLVGPGVGDEEGKIYGQTVDRAVGFRKAGEAELIEAKDMEESRYLSAREIEWVSLEDNFFLVAAVPMQGVAEVKILPLWQRLEVVEGRPRFLPMDTSSSEEDLQKEQAIVLQADGPEIEVDTYFGAKRYSHLREIPYHLEDAVRWGFLGMLSKPLYLLLRWVHDLAIPNYGWAIVLVTLLIRVGLFPLTLKGQRSMQKMQALNPKVKAIRAKYRPKLKDKKGKPNMEAQRKMNEEVMAVYKSAGVNPASGCFPLLIQAPIFFAFYRLLLTAVELRGAEWFLWIDDLAVPDPWYILPVLTTITAVANMKMTPSSPDPMQRRLMQMMPLMFGVFAIALPAGLVLYWTTSNSINMLQQKIINRPSGDESDTAKASKSKKSK